VPVDFANLRSPRRDFALVAAAGPASNIVLALIGAAVLATAVRAPSPGLFVELVFAISSLNVLLAVFNMLPIPPLDGGNVLIGVLPAAAAGVVERLRPFGFILLYALMLTGTLWTLIGPVYRLIIGWLL
jgi:Zn-dependent protease